MEVAIVPFDRALHGRFVESEAMNAADKWPHFLRREPGLKYRLADLVMHAALVGQAAVAVVPEDHDLFVAFLVASGPQRIAYGYTKYGLRRMGIASRLCVTVGIDLTRPVALDIWTPAASRIAAKGRPLYPAIPKQDRKHEQRRDQDPAAGSR